MAQSFDFKKNEIPILFLRLYRNTITRSAFITACYNENALLGWEERQLGCVWDIFELVHTETLEEMFRNYLDLTQ